MENKTLNVLEREVEAVSDESSQARLNNIFTQTEGWEDVSRRGEFVKHFNLGGNRRQAIMYAQPVHYRDAEGKWADIDNTLEAAVTPQGRKVLRNRSNRTRIEFPQEMDGGSMASISCEGKTFSWRFEQDVRAVPAKLRSGAELKQARLVERAKALPQFVGRTLESLQAEDLAAKIETAQQQRMSPTLLHAENRYDEVLSGIALRYELMGEALKEDIILAHGEALSRAAIRLPDDFDYRVSEAQTLEILEKDSGETLFVMDTPLIRDAAGAETIGGIRLTPCAGYTRMEYSIPDEFLKAAVWPVTIDPTVRYAKNRSNIEDAGLYRTEAPNTPHPNKEDYNCGNRGEYEYITLIRFNELVKQKASDTIVSARIGMHPTSSHQKEEYMACYPMKKTWSAATATWNNIYPDTTEYISDEVISYVDSTGTTCYFDITNLYRSWYLKDKNFGVAFRYPLGVDGQYHYVTWAGAKRNSENGPCVVVNYLSHAGLESWWEYESMGAGRAGTAHVDLFNGNLVFEHGDVAASGSRMPVSLTHYYNSCLSLTNEQGCGMGWRLSANQSLYKTSLYDANWNKVNYYVWTDGDGTEHYFRASGSTPYKDEETQTLKLSISGSTATIRSKDDTAMKFPLPADATKKYISSITDACGNAVNFTYDATSGLLTAITDGAGRTTTLTYVSGLLTQIQAPDQETVKFEYANQQLTKIVHAGQTTLFKYQNGLLSEADSSYGSAADLGVKIGYSSLSDYDATALYGVESCRVTSLEQTGIANRGAMLCFNYLTSMTKVTALKSGDATNPVGKTLSYQFNGYGNLACVFDELGYARCAEFDEYNAQQKDSRMQKAVVNLAKDLAFAAGATAWTQAKANAADVIAQDTATRCLSMPSLKIVKSGAGETRTMQTAQVGKAGKYTFSAYVKADALAGGGAFLRITSGANRASSAIVQASTANASCGPAAEGWERVSASVDASAGSVTLELVCAASSGTAWFACPQLESGEIANRANLLANGDFSRTVTNTANASATRLFPADWSPAAGISASALNGVLTSGHGMPAFLSGNALRMESFPAAANVGFNQEIPVSGAKDDVFVIGGWVSSHSVSSGSKQSAPCIAYRFTNGSTNGEWKYADFNREWIGWQFGACAITAPSAYTKITFSVNYARNAQTGMFSNMFMYREQFGQSFAYDSKKNLTSVQNLAGQKSNMVYDTFDNLTSYVQPGAAETDKYEFTYGSEDDLKKHLVRSSTTPMGVKQEFQYDAYGNQTLSKTVDGTNAVMGIQTTYDANSNYPIVTTDARGNSVTREVDANSGLLRSVTDPANQKVTYTYDSSKRVTEVKAQANSKTYRNTYTYEKDRIKTVSHNTTSDTCDVTYNFNYDGLGRKTSVSVGTQTLSTNVYSNDRNGLLTEVQYGNGGKVKYTYDDFDRLTGVSYDSETTPRYAYTYDASGEVAKVKDNHLNRTIETERDLAFRPRQSTLKDGNGNTLYRTTLYYDKMNRLEKFAELAGGTSHTTAYAYDKDNRTTEINYDGNSNKISYTYDKLGRVTNRKSKIGANEFSTTYSYLAGNASLYGANATTPLVSSIAQPQISFDYAYDSRGNIISEKRYAPGTAEASKKTTTYAYDALGQLVRVNDPHEGCTWLYEYDRGGNIVCKKKCTLNTATVTQTINYAYGDAGWKDKLTSYNGKTITYDAIGNPLDDGERTYTWGAGRQLKHITMLLSGTDHGFRTTKGKHTDSNTILRIAESGSTLVAKVFRGTREITSECPASAFKWTRTSGNTSADTTWNDGHVDMKSIPFTDTDIANGVKYNCTYTETQGSYGTVSVNNALTASHTQSTADANHTFSLTNGMLKVNITNNAGNGTEYTLNGNALQVNNGFSGSITAMYEFTESNVRDVDFVYDHNGLRTRKTVTENGVSTVYDYTLHGKLITHMTKRVGNTISDTLHFFYDAQSKPAFVKWNNVMYRYVHNLQGDIVGILDANGKLVVEYKYDAWGKPLSIDGSSKTTLGALNPFRYRGYVWDAEIGLYYLKNRYYSAEWLRFINCDTILDLYCEIHASNGFCYCKNNSINYVDYDGFGSFRSMVPPREAGFIPPKSGAQNLPSDYGVGWRDKYGNIWVPDSSGHGGNHWDVHRRDGKGYVNVYPDGHKRVGKGKEPNLPPASPLPNASPAPSTTPGSNKIDASFASEVTISTFPVPAPRKRPDNLPEHGGINTPEWLKQVLGLAVGVAVGYFLGPEIADKVIQRVGVLI